MLLIDKALALLGNKDFVVVFCSVLVTVLSLAGIIYILVTKRYVDFSVLFRLFVGS